MHETVKHGTLDEHMYLCGFYWMTDAWLQSLPEDLQDLVLDGVVQMAAAVQSDWNKQHGSRSLEELVASGGTIRVPTAEEASFVEARDVMKRRYLYNAEERLQAWESASSEAEATIDAERARIAGRKS